MANKLSDIIFVHHHADTIETGHTYTNSNEECQCNKPVNGLWATRKITGGCYSSKWEEFCKTEHHNCSGDLNKKCLFKLKEDADILVIDSKNELLNLDKKYGEVKFTEKKLELSKQLEKTDIKDDSYKTLLKEFFSAKSGVVRLNIEKIEQDYDGIFLTENGYYSMKEFFEIWDVESLVLFNSNCIITE